MPDGSTLSKEANAAVGKDAQTRRQLEALISLSDRFGDLLANAFVKDAAEEGERRDIRSPITAFSSGAGNHRSYRGI